MPSQQFSFTLSIDSSDSDLTTTGGKGHNLSILSRDGRVLVPPGFVVTTAAYHHFVNHDGKQLQTEIEIALGQLRKDGESTTTAAASDLEAISATIQAAFRKCRLAKVLQSEIESRLSNLFPNSTQYFAV